MSHYSPFMRACYWTILVVTAWVVALALAECTAHISGADQRVIDAWRDQWPVSDTLEMVE